MEVKHKTVKILFITVLVVLITVLHYSTMHGHIGLHIIHRELYFVPIILAGLWFGLNYSLFTAVAVSLIYAPHVFIYNDPHGNLLTVATQVLVFIAVAVVLGLIVERQRRQQQQPAALENLGGRGRAAAAIGQEMNDLLKALRALARQPDQLACTEMDRNFQQEMVRLERMVDVLANFAPKEEVPLISHDLNVTIQEHMTKLRPAAEKAGVVLEVQLDPNGCPSRVNPEKIGWILENLVKNALEVTRPGQNIHIRSQRGGQFCQVSVADQGPGIQPVHIGKMFTPFFTTKKDGQGLALAGCKKILKDLGGDIRVESTLGEGATFTMWIPREKQDSPFDEGILPAQG